MQSAPEEILNQIFSLALEEEEHLLSSSGVGITHTALTVSSVSRYWRQIALSYSPLWRLITIYVKNPPSSQSKSVRQFTVLGKHEFRVHLLEFRLTNETRSNLREALGENDLYQKVRGLCIFPASLGSFWDTTGWNHWGPDLSIPSLHFLNIVDQNSYTSRERFPNGLCQAKHVRILGGNLVFENLPAITGFVTFHLETSLLNPDGLRRILYSAPNLRCLTAIGDSIVLSDNSQRLTYQNLEELVVNYSDILIPPMVSFPSLRRIETTQASQSPKRFQVNTFWTEFENPEQIKEAGMWVYWKPTNVDITALTRFTAITQLTFHCFRDTISEIIILLTTYIYNHFPSLTALKLFIKPEPEMTDDLSDLLVELLRARNNASRTNHVYSSITLISCNVVLSTLFHDYAANEGIEFKLSPYSYHVGVPS